MQGHPELTHKFQFIERLVERTPTRMEQLSGDHLAWFDAEEQREIMNGYKARQAASKAIRATPKPYTKAASSSSTATPRKKGDTGFTARERFQP